MKNHLISRTIRSLDGVWAKRFRDCTLALAATCLLVTVIHGPAFSQSSNISTEPPQPRKWEVGVEGLRLDLGYRRWTNTRYMNTVQPMPGLYLRRYLGQWGLRVGAQWGRHYNENDPSNCSDCGYQEIRGTSLGLYAGGSYRVLPRQEWLHAVADISWQMFLGQGEYINFAWGHQHGLQDFHFQEAMLRLGVNLRLPIGEHLSLGTEWTIGSGIRSLSVGTEFITEQNESHYHKVGTPLLEPAGNLILAVRF